MSRFDDETPSQEHARFDLHFHAERYVAGEREGGLEAAALEYARACGWKSPEEITARDARRVPPIVIDGMGTAVAAKELADAERARAAELRDELTVERERVSGLRQLIVNISTVRWENENGSWAGKTPHENDLKRLELLSEEIDAAVASPFYGADTHGCYHESDGPHDGYTRSCTKCGAWLSGPRRSETEDDRVQRELAVVRAHADKAAAQRYKDSARQPEPPTDEQLWAAFEERPMLIAELDQLTAVLREVVFSLERNDAGRTEGRMPQKADWEVALSMAKAALGHGT